MKKSWRTIFILVGVCTLVAGCKTLPGPKETSPDGLVRVPSRGAGGVFREANWPFTQYQRLILEPLTVSFVKDWEKNHKEVSAKEIRRIRDEAASIFRDEFERELIKQGNYTFANDPGPDALIVSPTVTDLDIPAPENEDISMRSFAPKSVGMRITGELRDAASGRLVGRVDMFAGGDRYGTSELRPANRGTNAFEMRNAMSEWTRLLREALNVAKTDRQP
jgi:hypothetical protein